LQRALPPSELAVREGDPGELVLSWRAPEGDGGHDVAAYAASVLRRASERAEAAEGNDVWEELDMTRVARVAGGLHTLAVDASVHESLRFRVRHLATIAISIACLVWHVYGAAASCWC
jgi:hypothetical protein